MRLQISLKYIGMQSLQNTTNSFFSFVKNIYTSLQVCNFEQALTKCIQYQHMNADERLQINSIKAYILMNLDKFQQANQILQQCLKEKPLHIPSLKRKASLFQKMGNKEQAQEKFTFILYLQPQSRSLKNKLKKIKMKNTNLSGKSQESSDSKDNNKQIQKKQKPGVKFGSFEVIDIATEDSDQHFAIIKEQLSKLSTKKPKKSILKQPMSASFFSEKKKKNFIQKSEKIEQKFEQIKKKQQNVWVIPKSQTKVKMNDSEIKKKKNVKVLHLEIIYNLIKYSEYFVNNIYIYNNQTNLKMDPIANFKQEVQAMFDKSFKQLSQKNNINKTILSNLIEAASQQSNKINKLDSKIQNIKKANNPDLGIIKNQIKNQQKQIHENFDKMMFRLSQVEEGINHSKKNLQQNLQVNKQSQQSMNQLLRQLQKIQKQQHLPQYHGNKDQLYQQIQQFQRILQSQRQRIKVNDKKVQISKKTVLQPLNTFQTKIAIHNKNNQNILKQKLIQFSNKLKQVQKRVQDAAWLVKTQTTKAKQQQTKIVQQMRKVQKQMTQLRNQFQHSDKRRKQQIKNNAIRLDQMVQQMLVQTKKLQLRVEQLKKGYQNQTKKLKKDIN